MLNTKLILLVSCFITIAIQARLDFNSQDCNKYLEKFGTADNADGKGASKIAFTGDVAFVTGTANVQVNTRYSDVDLFNDPQFYGLVQEDGKTAESTCLDLKLYKFSSNTYSDKVEVTTLKITPSNNFQKQWRYYSFQIQGEDLSKYLVQTSNSEQYIYNGYFAIAFFAAGTDQVQYTFFFEFQVIINRNNGAAIDTIFKPLSQTSTAGCSLEAGASCVTRPDTVLNWCQDSTCATKSTPNLHLNDQFYLQQVITTSGMGGYYLTGVVVYYTGDGLNKKATILSVNNAVKGQVTLQLKAEIAWTKVVIKVTSVLSTTASGNRRMLAQTTYDTVTGQSEEITCIKVENENRCATCAEQKSINGYSSDSCNETEEPIEDENNSSNIIFMGLVILLAIII